MNNRTPDRIVVNVYEPSVVEMATAWADLRAVVYDATGFDIEHGTHFAIRSMPVRGSGNRATHAFVAAPRNATTPEDMIKRGFLSLYGEMPLWAADDFRAAAERDMRPVFALPLSSAMKVLN